MTRQENLTLDLAQRVARMEQAVHATQVLLRVILVMLSGSMALNAWSVFK